ncbi:MAG: hypothetical protein ACJ73D_12385 [Pyrinomonadaceae bacterium]
MSIVPNFRSALAACAVLVATAVFTLAQDKNLTADEIIARNLKSFGSADAIAKSQNRMAVGTADFTALNTQKKASGSAVLASDGKDLAFFSTFDLRDYRMERIGLFSNKVVIPNIDEGHKSPLGEFLSAYDKLLGARLFGGSIFSNWALYNASATGFTMESEGKKKVNNKDAWLVKIVPKGGLGTGSYIKLYFDAKDFHHIRTVYRQAETERGSYAANGRGGTGSPPGAWDQDMANNGSQLTEDFEDFSNDAAGISLPHKYSVLLSINSVKGSSEFTWKFAISEYKLIKAFPADFFSFKAEIK